MSYIEVKDLAADERQLLTVLYGIECLCHSQEGIDTLNTNIRIKQTEPEIDKLRTKYGGE